MELNKEKFKKILDKYQEAEEIIMRLDSEFGITMWESMEENFYNKYNWCIFALFEYLFGKENRELIEDYLFDTTNISFDELCKVLNIND